MNIGFRKDERTCCFDSFLHFNSLHVNNSYERGVLIIYQFITTLPHPIFIACNINKIYAITAANATKDFVRIRKKKLFIILSFK